MIPYLQNRGFNYGSGMISPDRRKFLVNIPKNASSYLTDWTRSQGWNTATIDNSHAWNNIQEMVVVLRDPVERWISGMAQYIKTYILSPFGPNGPLSADEANTEYDSGIDAGTFIKHYNFIVERLLFDVISLYDDHVWAQHEFFEELLPDKERKFFLMGPLLDNDIGSYLGLKPMTGLDMNRGDSNNDTRVLQTFFRERLNLRPELINRLHKHYQKDLDLINKVLA